MFYMVIMIMVVANQFRHYISKSAGITHVFDLSQVKRVETHISCMTNWTKYDPIRFLTCAVYI